MKQESMQVLRLIIVINFWVKEISKRYFDIIDEQGYLIGFYPDSLDHEEL